jgi:hypothetical protein
LNNKYFSYSEVDFNSDYFLSISELDHFSAVDTRYRCYYKGYKNKEDFVYLYAKDFNNTVRCKALILEVFSLKDGVEIKEIPINYIKHIKGTG